MAGSLGDGAVASLLAISADHSWQGNHGPYVSSRGKLRDTILDWEDSLPDRDLTLADEACRYHIWNFQAIMTADCCNLQ